MLLETWLLLEYIYIYMHSDYSLLIPSSLSLLSPFHLYQSSLNPFLSQFHDFGDSLSLPKAICVTTEL